MAEEHGKDKEPETDLDSLELEIDKEIDNLFVPVAKKQPEEPVPAKALEAEGAAPPEEKSQTTLDLESLELEIDNEIDNLFVPAAGKEDGEKISATPTEKEDISMPVPEAAPDVLAMEARPSPVEELHPPVSSTGFMAKYPPRADLPKLIEEFNAAYLSLDWEFSADNIRRLETALYDLESFASTAQGSASIFKILKALLARLGAKPESANNWIIELVRDSHSLLTHLLLSEGSLGPNEKERINALISRFRQMRERGISAREPRAVEAAAPEAPASVAVEPENLEPPSVAASAAAEAISPAPAFELSPEPFIEAAPPSLSISAEVPDRWSLLELKTWLESSRALLMEAVEGAESELARMRQIESAMAKTEGLSPVTARLSDIRSGLERHLNALRGQDDEWLDRAVWVENLERISTVYADATEEQADEPFQLSEPYRAPGPAAHAEPAREPEEVDEPLELTEPYLAPGPDTDAGPSGESGEVVTALRDDFILFRYSGRLYGISKTYVAKIRPISEKKALEILVRGYGNLADVKQLFRSIGKGVSGKLAGMSVKELKSIQFSLIGPEVFLDAQAPSSGAAIFVSDGSYHGLILSDSGQVDFLADAEITPEPCSCQAAWGTVRTDSGLNVEVLDFGCVARCVW